MDFYSEAFMHEASEAEITARLEDEVRKLLHADEG